MVLFFEYQDSSSKSMEAWSSSQPATIPTKANFSWLYVCGQAGASDGAGCRRDERPAWTSGWRLLRQLATHISDCPDGSFNQYIYEYIYTAERRDVMRFKSPTTERYHLDGYNVPQGDDVKGESWCLEMHTMHHNICRRMYPKEILRSCKSHFLHEAKTEMSSTPFWAKYLGTT